MSAGTTAPFGGSPFMTNGSDLEVNGKAYPGVILNPITGEPGGLYCLAGREVNGLLWNVVNADYGSLGWYQIDAALPSAATVLTPFGVYMICTAPAGAPNPIVWTTRTVTASVVPLPFAQGGTNTTFAPSAIPLPAGAGHSVVAWGDSITLGANGSGGFVATPFVQLVAAEFSSASGQTWTPVNLGISGTSLQNSGARGITDGIDRWNVAGAGGLNSLLSYAQADPQSYFILAYGINDMGEQPSYGFSPAQFFTNYSTVIAGLIAAGVPSDHIILMGLTYINVQSSQSPTYTTPYYQYEATKSQYTEQVCNLAIKFQTRYAETETYMAVNGATTLLNTDGLHPNQNGHNLLALAFENATFISAVYGLAIARLMQALSMVYTTGPLTTQLLSWSYIDQYFTGEQVLTGVLQAKLGIAVAIGHGLTLDTTDGSNGNIFGYTDNMLHVAPPSAGLWIGTLAAVYALITTTGLQTAYDGVHLGQVGPAFLASGATAPSTFHEIISPSGGVTGNGATTVNWPVAQAFASANYVLSITDQTTFAAVAATAKTIDSFTFTATTGHVYSYHARGV